MGNRNIIQGSQTGFNRSANAAVSLVCATIPIILFSYCLIVSGGSSNEGGGGAAWWLLAVYYWTVGVPLCIIWLVCGIFGLKAKNNKLAIFSLILKPISVILLLMAFFIF